MFVWGSAGPAFSDEQMQSEIWRVRQSEARYGDDYRLRGSGYRSFHDYITERTVKVVPHSRSCNCHLRTDCALVQLQRATSGWVRPHTVLPLIQLVRIECDADVQPALNAAAMLLRNDSYVPMESRPKPADDECIELLRRISFYLGGRASAQLAAPATLDEAADALEHFKEFELAERYRQLELDALTALGPKYKVDAWACQQQLAHFREWRVKRAP